MYVYNVYNVFVSRCVFFFLEACLKFGIYLLTLSSLLALAADGPDLSDDFA